MTAFWTFCIFLVLLSIRGDLIDLVSVLGVTP